MPRAGVTDAELLEAARATAGDTALSADAWVDGLAADSRRANDLALLVLLGPAGIYAGIAIVNATLIGAAHRAPPAPTHRATRRHTGADPAYRDCGRHGLTTTAGLLLGGTTTAFLGWLVRRPSPGT